MPYRKDFENSSDATGWYFDGKYEYRKSDYNQGYQIRHYYRVPPFNATDKSSNAFSPEFYTPAETPIYYKATLEIGNEGSSPSNVTVNLGVTSGTTVAVSTSKSFKEYNGMILSSGDSILDDNGSLTNKQRVVISSDKPSYTNYVNHRVVVQYLDVLYR